MFNLLSHPARNCKILWTRWISFYTVPISSNSIPFLFYLQPLPLLDILISLSLPMHFLLVAFTLIYFPPFLFYSSHLSLIFISKLHFHFSFINSCSFSSLLHFSLILPHFNPFSNASS